MSLGTIIRDIRKSKGYSIMKIKELTGLSKSTISEIENDKSSPTTATLEKIAKALDVTINDFFINKDTNLIENNKTTELSPKAEKDIKKALGETLDQLENSQDALMFDGEPIDDETRELLRFSLENSMRIAKKIAKEKYTPKKYKK